MPFTYTLKDMQTFAAVREGKCLSRNYVDGSSILKWMCKRGHTWDMSYTIFRQGSWCPQCARHDNARERLEELRGIALKKKGKCLAPAYINAVTKLKFQCEEGHTWYTVPNSIKKGMWCPKCAIIKMRHSIEDLRRFAKRKGGKLISKTYKSNTEKILWECKEGHRWFTMVKTVQKGAWCPACANNQKHTLDDMHRVSRQRGGNFLSKEYKGSNIKHTWQCARKHIWDACPSSVFKGRWCIICAGKSKMTIEEMHAIAEKRGGKCLSKKYKNSRSKLTWQCSKGHSWQATPGSVKAGQWCAHCAGVAKLTIKEMKLIAEGRNGKCLSSEYKGATTKLTWQCSKKHIWDAQPYAVKFGSWCPHCARANLKLPRPRSSQKFKNI